MPQWTLALLIWYGFDPKVLQAAFKVPEEVIREIMGASKAPPIIHAVKKEKLMWQDRVLKAFLESKRSGFFDSINGKHKKKTEAYNVFEEDPDFKNCNGWSVTVDRKDLKSLKHSNVGVFMVNLTKVGLFHGVIFLKGSMMAPHWNPRASEISIVLHGQGIVRVICSSNAKESECENMRYRVEEGDVFAVPRFHPMAQMSFNNGSFVFMGFSTSTRRNHPQFLAGKRSALGSLDRQILALSFNVSNTTIDQLLTPQKESVILDCTSCAEEEERLMEEEIERKMKEEEARKRKEEEEEETEEARRRKEEEEEARKREEEEEVRRREEEEAQRRKEEEEARRREKEEARQRREEEEGGRRRKDKKTKRKEARREQEKAQRQEEERQRRAKEEETKEGGDEGRGQRRFTNSVWDISLIHP